MTSESAADKSDRKKKYNYPSLSLLPKRIPHLFANFPLILSCSLVFFLGLSKGHHPMFQDLRTWSLADIDMFSLSSFVPLFQSMAWIFLLLAISGLPLGIAYVPWFWPHCTQIGNKVLSFYTLLQLLLLSWLIGFYLHSFCLWLKHYKASWWDKMEQVSSPREPLDRLLNCQCWDWMD